MPGAECAGGIHLSSKDINSIVLGEMKKELATHLFAVVVTASIESRGGNILHKVHLRTMWQE